MHSQEQTQNDNTKHKNTNLRIDNDQTRGTQSVILITLNMCNLF